VALRNLKVGGEFTITGSSMGTQLFIGNNASASGLYAPLVVGHADPRFERQDSINLAEQASGRPLSQSEVSAYWRKRAVEFIESHPGDWLRLMGKKSLMTWNVREAEDIDDFYIYQEWSRLLAFLGWMNFGLLAPLAALGVVLTWNSWRRQWLLYLIVMSLAFSVALFYVFARYRFSLVPVLVLFAGAGLGEIPKIVQERRISQLLSGVVALIAMAGVVRWPVLPPPGPGVAGYNNLAIAFGKVGMVKEAIESYQHALELDPTSAATHYNIGSLLALEGEVERASDHLRKALEYNTDYLEARNNLGNVLILRGDAIGAADEFHAALRLNPAFKKVRFNLGVALIRAGEFTEARKELTRFVKISNDPFDAYRANVLLSQPRLDHGIDDLKKPMKLSQELSERAALTRILMW
jgi:tetratricopeptide (TPR) repeat protein